MSDDSQAHDQHHKHDSSCVDRDDNVLDDRPLTQGPGGSGAGSFKPHPNKAYCRHDVELGVECRECGPPDESLIQEGSGAGSTLRLRDMMVAADLALPLKVDYDGDSDDYKSWDWAWRIKGVVNFVEEHDESWPQMKRDSEGALVDPRAEYIAAALNEIPSLVAALEAARAENERLKGNLERLLRKPDNSITTTGAEYDAMTAELAQARDDIQKAEADKRWLAEKATEMARALGQEKTDLEAARAENERLREQWPNDLLAEHEELPPPISAVIAAYLDPRQAPGLRAYIRAEIRGRRQAESDHAQARAQLSDAQDECIRLGDQVRHLRAVEQATQAVVEAAQAFRMARDDDTAAQAIRDMCAALDALPDAQQTRRTASTESDALPDVQTPDAAEPRPGAT